MFPADLMLVTDLSVVLPIMMMTPASCFSSGRPFGTVGGADIYIISNIPCICINYGEAYVEPEPHHEGCGSGEPDIQPILSGVVCPAVCVVLTVVSVVVVTVSAGL